MSPPFIFLLAAFLARYLEFVAGNEPPVTVSTCVDLALARGDSPEGWTVVKNKFCEQKISRLVCVSGVNYFNLNNNGDNDCCDPPRHVTWQNELARSGWCCNTGETWIGDKEMNKGRCCLNGSKLVDGVCEKPTAPVESMRCDRPKDNNYVCANSDHLGIKYGSCYIITFPDGKQLGRNRDDNYYVKDGYLQDIPFKVCKQAKDCGSVGSVGHDGSFTLEDQIGGLREDIELKGWITDHNNGRLLHLTFSPHSAGNFKGSATLSRGACAVRIISTANGGGGLSYAHSMEKPGLSFYPNKRAGLGLHFTEVDCDGGVLGLNVADGNDVHNKQHSFIPSLW